MNLNSGLHSPTKKSVQLSLQETRGLGKNLTLKMMRSSEQFANNQLLLRTETGAAAPSLHLSKTSTQHFASQKSNISNRKSNFASQKSNISNKKSNFASQKSHISNKKSNNPLLSMKSRSEIYSISSDEQYYDDYDHEECEDDDDDDDDEILFDSERAGRGGKQNHQSREQKRAMKRTQKINDSQQIPNEEGMDKLQELKFYQQSSKPKIKLELEAALGANCLRDKTGNLFKFLQLPEIYAHSADNHQKHRFVQVVGRQVVIRSLSNPSQRFINIEPFSKITALETHTFESKMIIAIAGTLLTQKQEVFISIYSLDIEDRLQVIIKKHIIDIQTPPRNPNTANDDSQNKQQNLLIQPHQGKNERVSSAVKSFEIGSITFSEDQQYLALLVCGIQNAIHLFDFIKVKSFYMMEPLTVRLYGTQYTNAKQLSNINSAVQHYEKFGRQITSKSGDINEQSNESRSYDSSDNDDGRKRKTNKMFESFNQDFDELDESEASQDSNSQNLSILSKNQNSKEKQNGPKFIEKISFLPALNNARYQILASGPEGVCEFIQVRLNKIEESKFGKLFPDLIDQLEEMLFPTDSCQKIEQVNFTDHSISKNGQFVVAATDCGFLLVWNKERKETIQIIKTEEMALIQAVKIFNNALVVALKDEESTVLFYQLCPETASEFVIVMEQRFSHIYMKRCEKSMQIEESEPVYTLPTLHQLLETFEILETDNNLLMLVLSCDKQMRYTNLSEEVFLDSNKQYLIRRIKEYERVKGHQNRQQLKSMTLAQSAKMLIEFEEQRQHIADINFKLLNNGFHGGSIASIQTCSQRPILMSVSVEDQTIRIWNYFENKCELVKNFARPPPERKSPKKKRLTSPKKKPSLAELARQERQVGDKYYTHPLKQATLHPSGYQLAVVLADQIVLYHILYQELRMFRTLQIKNVKHISFSSGGQYLIVTESKCISVYNSMTFVKVAAEMTSKNTKNLVKTSVNDQVLAFTTSKGLYQLYNTEDLTKIGDISKRQDFKYYDLTFVTKQESQYAPTQVSHEITEVIKDNKELVVVGKKPGNGGLIAYFNGDDLKAYYSYVDYAERLTTREKAKVAFNCIVQTQKLSHRRKIINNLVVGDSMGDLTVLNMPPNQLHTMHESIVQHLNVHCGEVTSVCTSNDGRYLFSSGSDGNIFVYKIHEVSISKQKDAHQKQKSSNQQVGRLDINFNDLYSIFFYSYRRQNNIPKARPQRQEQDGHEVSLSQGTENAHDQSIEGEEEEEEEVKEDHQQTTVVGMPQPDILSELSFDQETNNLQNSEGLAKIVLFSRNKLQKWKQDHDDLQYQMQGQAMRVEDTLRNENVKFVQMINKMIREKQETLTALSAKYEKLQMDEAQQKDDAIHDRQRVESQHYNMVLELQQLFDKKIDLEIEKYKELKRATQVMISEYESKIQKIKTNNVRGMDELEKVYQERYRQLTEEFTKTKLLMNEETDKAQTYVNEVKSELEEAKRLKIRKQDDAKAQLDKMLAELDGSIMALKWQKTQFEEEKRRYNEDCRNLRSTTAKYSEKLLEYERKQKELRIQQEMVRQTIREMEEKLAKSKAEVLHYQKTKLVLSHTCLEAKQNLEPKLQSIDNLREGLKARATVYSKVAKAIERVEANFDLKKDLFEALKQKYKREKHKTAKKQAIIANFTLKLRVAATYQNKDTELEKQIKIAKFLEIVKDMQQFFATEDTEGQRNPAILQEVERQRQFMEKGLKIMKDQADKNREKANRVLAQKTDENRELMLGLDRIRTLDRHCESQQSQINLDICQIMHNKRLVQKSINEMQHAMKKRKEELEEQAKNKLFAPKISSKNTTETCIQSRVLKQKQQFFSLRKSESQQISSEVLRNIQKSNQIIRAKPKLQALGELRKGRQTNLLLQSQSSSSLYYTTSSGNIPRTTSHKSLQTRSVLNNMVEDLRRSSETMHLQTMQKKELQSVLDSLERQDTTTQLQRSNRDLTTLSSHFENLINRQLDFGTVPQHLLSVDHAGAEFSKRIAEMTSVFDSIASPSQALRDNDHDPQCFSTVALPNEAIGSQRSADKN